MYVETYDRSCYLLTNDIFIETGDSFFEKFSVNEIVKLTQRGANFSFALHKFNFHLDVNVFN